LYFPKMPTNLEWRKALCFSREPLTRVLQCKRRRFLLLIDSHAHLDSSRYSDDREAMLRRAWEAGVGAVLAIGIGEQAAEMHRALEICRQFSGQQGVPRFYARR